MIYHITTKNNWHRALQLGFYEAPSLATEGFIHLSKEEQVPGVKERYYKNAVDLILLHIDENKLDATLKYELSPSINEAFPHLYGRLNINAVVSISEI